MFDVLIVTTEKVLFENKVKSLVLPGEHGVFEILDYHKPVMARLMGGNIFAGVNVFKICRGIVGFSKNKATVIVEQ
ncbi:MAG: hypothetical protein ABH882_07030 [Candidatus Omnitrophota bacterium]|nr:hypothetical protein [Candidatus Omnitrophota bacterium]MBU1928708.1 hypothetical protein [Candidatus Omnitrophota bacterium]MBU2034163.1 hypothetical protein [Candidatus Omnitrophota bacterium]MBU2221308.1 hypothetical protein [Candidatus Omnitrophota bacterium]MBU2258303.1 hypothetical protein [Candidatus Omnitrophota bacterium]